MLSTGTNDSLRVGRSQEHGVRFRILGPMEVAADGTSAKIHIQQMSAFDSEPDLSP